MKYLIINEDKTFGFKVEGIHEIVETDIAISDEIYKEFFQKQSQGINLRIKDNYSNESFDNLFEEYTLEPVPLEPTSDEILAQTLVEVQMDLANKNIQLEQMAQTIAEMQIGGMI